MGGGGREESVNQDGSTVGMGCGRGWGGVIR